MVSFACNLYSIATQPNKLYDISQGISFVDYTDCCTTIKCWDPHTRQLKHFTSEKIMNGKIIFFKDGHLDDLQSLGGIIKVSDSGFSI